MCQSRSEGGRRCAAHLPGSRALQKLAVAISGLKNSQVLSIFHDLRKEGKDSIVPNDRQYQNYIEVEEQRLQSTQISSAKKRRIDSLLQEAKKDATPDAATFYAMKRIVDRSIRAAQKIQGVINILARRLGMKPQDAQIEFNRQLDLTYVPAAHQTKAAAFEKEKDSLSPHLIDLDTTRVYSQMLEQADNPDKNAAMSSKHRIQRKTTGHSTIIAEAGYDDGRLDVVLKNTAPVVHAYHNVPDSLANKITSSEDAMTALREVVSNPDHQYATSKEAQSDGYAYRCHGCGQFRSLTHTCPQRDEHEDRDFLAHLFDEEDSRSTDHDELMRIFEVDEPDTFEEPSDIYDVREMPHRVQVAGSYTHGRLVELFPELEGMPLVDDISGFPHAINTGMESADDKVGISSSPEEMRKVLLTGKEIVTSITWEGSREEETGQDEFGYPIIESNRFSVSGPIVLGIKDSQVNLVRADLRCICPDYKEYYHCQHVDYVQNQSVRIGSMNGYGNITIGQMHQFAQAKTLKDRERNWGEDQEFLDRMSKRHREVPEEESYTKNFDAFKSVYDNTLKSLKTQERDSILPFATHNVLGDLGKGRQFGVELEFDIPDGEDFIKIRQEIANRLHQEGILASTEQSIPGAGSKSGWTGWSFEFDGSIPNGGELVSPIMTDNPDDWENLAKVCQILKECGAQASPKVGSHVHVSSASYGNSIDKYAELAQLGTQHEDVLYRLSTNPLEKNAKHRPTEYCKVNTIISERSVRIAHREKNLFALGEFVNNSIEYRAVNLEDQRIKSNHVEFRQWDGTLDPAAIQAQVILSIGMLSAAERNVDTHGRSTAFRENLGSHHQREVERTGTHRQAVKETLEGSRRKLSPEELKQDTATFRSFVDTIFDNLDHKERATKLFAMTQWQESNL